MSQRWYCSFLKNTRKIKIYKKRKKVEGPILRSKQHFTFKYRSTTQNTGGEFWTFGEGNLKTKTLKSLTLTRSIRRPHHPKAFFSFPSFQSPLTITSHSPLPSAQIKPAAQVPPSGYPIFSSLPGHFPLSFWKKPEDQGNHPWSPSSLSWSHLYFGWKSDSPS